MIKLVLTILFLQATLLPLSFAAQSSKHNVCPAILSKIESNSFKKYVSSDEAQILKEYALQNRWPGPLSDENRYTTLALKFISNIRFLANRYRMPYPLSSTEDVVVQDWIEPLNFKTQVRSDAVQHTTDECETKNSGLCFQAEESHVVSVLRPLITKDMNTPNAGAAVIVVLEGVGVVGVVKYFNEPTFIALRDVISSDGHYRLIRGAIYNIALSMYVEQIRPLKAAQAKFSTITVSELTVSPGRFLDPASSSFAGLFSVFQNPNLSERMVLRRQWKDFRKSLLGVLNQAERYIEENK